MAAKKDAHGRPDKCHTLIAFVMYCIIHLFSCRPTCIPASVFQ